MTEKSAKQTMNEVRFEVIKIPTGREESFENWLHKIEPEASLRSFDSDSDSPTVDLEDEKPETKKVSLDAEGLTASQSDIVADLRSQTDVVSGANSETIVINNHGIYCRCFVRFRALVKDLFKPCCAGD